MAIHHSKAAVVVFAAALFLYFFSEAVLRQAALSKLSASKIKIETVVSKLPQGIRDKVKKKIEYSKLRDAVILAKTDEHQIRALISLAFVEPVRKKEKIYRKIVQKYPDYPSSSQAFLYFLQRQNSETPISISEYHAFIKRCPQLRHFGLWQSGMVELQRKSAHLEQQFAYLQPLLNFNPDFRDYEMLYSQLAHVATQLGKEQAKTKANLLADSCLEKPLLEEELMKIELEKIKAEEKK